MGQKISLVATLLAAASTVVGCASRTGGDSAAAPSSGTRYALLIGVSHYQRPMSNYVPSAAAEAEKTSDALLQFAGFDTSNITVLTDAGRTKPTRANILKQIEQLSRKIKPSDSVFVYFGGHGFSRSGRDYFMPWDVDWRSEEAAKKSALPVSLLLSRLNRLPAKTLITVYESCRHDARSDAYAPPSAPVVGQNLKQQVLEQKPQVSATIYSCRSGEITYGTPDGSMGYLSGYLRWGLQGAAANARGDVTIGGLSSYLTKAVFGAVRLNHGISQRPEALISSARLQHPVQRPVQRPEEVVVCSGRPPGNGGRTARPFSSPRSAQEKYQNAMQAAYEALLRGDQARARQDFVAASRADPKSPYAAKELAALCDQSRDWRGARKWHQRVVQLWPKDVGSLNRLGEIAQAQGESAQAEALYQKAVALDGKWPVPMKNLGLIYRQRSQYQKAEHWFKRACASAPTWPEPLLYLAWLKTFQKHNAEALILYRKLVEISPTSPVALFNIAVFYRYRLKNLGKAEQFYRRAVRAEPRQGGHYANLADCLLDRNRRGEAFILARKAIALGYKVNHPAYQRLHIQPGTAKRSSASQS